VIGVERLEWHLRVRLAPILYDDHQRAAAPGISTESSSVHPETAR
jgi:hypothetical protein